MDNFSEKNKITKDNRIEISHHLGNASEIIHACISLGKTRKDIIVALTEKPQEHLKNLRRISEELEDIDEDDLLWGEKDAREELKKCIKILENIPENPTKEFENSLKGAFHPLMKFFLGYGEKDWL